MKLNLNTIRTFSRSQWALIAANIYPIFGVIFLHWDAKSILLLYWAESAIIGFYNILKMLKAGQAQNKLGFSIVMSLFFMSHFGGFMFVHLLFILFIIYFKGLQMVSDPTLVSLLTKASPTSGTYLNYMGLIIPLVMLFISHGISYYKNFLGNEEYKNKSLVALMAEPYSRIAVMHLTIILGGILSIVLNSYILILIPFILLKIFVDLSAHTKQNQISYVAPEPDFDLTLKPANSLSQMLNPADIRSVYTSAPADPNISTSPNRLGQFMIPIFIIVFVGLFLISDIFQFKFWFPLFTNQNNQPTIHNINIEQTTSTPATQTRINPANLFDFRDQLIQKLNQYAPIAGTQITPSNLGDEIAVISVNNLGEPTNPQLVNYRFNITIQSMPPSDSATKTFTSNNSTAQLDKYSSANEALIYWPQNGYRIDLSARYANDRPKDDNLENQAVSLFQFLTK